MKGKEKSSKWSINMSQSDYRGIEEKNEKKSSCVWFKVTKSFSKQQHWRTDKHCHLSNQCLKTVTLQEASINTVSGDFSLDTHKHSAHLYTDGPMDYRKGAVGKLCHGIVFSKLTKSL